VETVLNAKLAEYFEKPGDRPADHHEDRGSGSGREQRGAPAELTRAKGALESASLPGKLADCRRATRPVRSCTWSRETRRRLGQTGAGTGASRRSCRCGGKILNFEKARFDKLLANQEIRTMIQCMGTGIGRRTSTSQAALPNKIIIMTDADVDRRAHPDAAAHLLLPPLQQVIERAISTSRSAALQASYKRRIATSRTTRAASFSSTGCPTGRR